jgi:hypothetical protein
VMKGVPPSQAAMCQPFTPYTNGRRRDRHGTARLIENS